MPSSGGRLGVNEPPPAATTITLQWNTLPSSVARRKRPSGSFDRAVDALAEMEHRRGTA